MLSFILLLSNTKVHLIILIFDRKRHLAMNKSVVILHEQNHTKKSNVLGMH